MVAYLGTFLACTSLTFVAGTFVMHHVSTCDQCGKAAKGHPGSWCDDPNCVPFEWDANHSKGDDLTTINCDSLGSKPKTYCLHGAWDLYAVALEPGPAPAPTPPSLPSVCSPSSTSAQFHITGMGGGAHDTNAIFNYKDVFHVMHQRNGGWGHLVSDDFVRWKRLPDALQGGSWDGSLTVLDGQPFILFDCTSVANCLPKSSQSLHLGSQVGDPPIIGVAWPLNASDPYLAEWEKDPANPAVFSGSLGYSGPSNVWKNGDRYQMEMILGAKTGLYETTDPHFHNWTLVNDSFYSGRGGGGGMFFELPRTVSGRATFTHMLQSDYHGDGTAWFVLGNFDTKTSIFEPGAWPVPIDITSNNLFTLVNFLDDGRMVHIGWATGSAGCQTVPREITYDANMVQLLSAPITELTSLRGDPLASHTAVEVPANGSLALLTEPSATFDLEADLALPSGKQFVARVSALAGDDAESVAKFSMRIAVSAPDGSGQRDVAVDVDTHNIRYTFKLPSGEHSISVRLLVDRTVVEAFVASGRAVITAPVKFDRNARSSYLRTENNPVSINTVAAWSMGCGWEPTYVDKFDEFVV